LPGPAVSLEEAAMKTLIPRFSLRFLLVAAALIPLGAYWFALPTLYAQRFAAAVTSGEYDAAEKLCIDRKEPFPGHWRKHQTFQPRPIVKDLTLRDLWAGRREMFVGIAYGDGQGLASCGVECTATRQGIEIGMTLP
jgi:hypothetical protein